MLKFGQILISFSLVVSTPNVGLKLWPQDEESHVLPPEPARDPTAKFLMLVALQSPPPIECFSQFFLSEVDAYVFYQPLPWFHGKLLKLRANFEAGGPFWGTTRCEKFSF